MLTAFDERRSGDEARGAIVEPVASRAAALDAALARGLIDRAAGIVTDALATGDTDVVSTLARIFATATQPRTLPGGHVRAPYPHGVSPGVSAAKLRHDWRQLRWLSSNDGAAPARRAAATRLHDLLAELESAGPEARFPWTSAAGRAALDALETARFVQPSPRLPHALSGNWDRAAANDVYRASRVGIVVIDDFLTAEALAELRQFCLGSTIWWGNRYPDGRLSALLLNGFASPLLMQTAEELRSALPQIIADHPLRQLWGFKYTERLPAGSTVHADCAAVNVNFWITPTCSNLDPATGGMTIFDTQAPPQWEFATYNRDIRAIQSYLEANRARAIHIPYRANRAVIFNSNLFHETDAVAFKDDYEHHRINVTFLYGDRPTQSGIPPRRLQLRAWRSRAFRRG